MNTPTNESKVIECRVVDIDMPFMSMVGFMVKFALAAIPALIILTILGVFAFALLTATGHSPMI
jgi:hypothetical protein